MSVKKFKFVSPGVFLSEIDNSQLPAVQDALGPVIVGRTAFGPAMRPVTVNSMVEFTEIFGAPVPGQTGGDVWREGNQQGPTYASYAAQAYLKGNVGPVTVMRLLGQSNRNYSGGESYAEKGAAGWTTAGDAPTGDGGSCGLFLIDSGSGSRTGHLAAIWYIQSGSVELSGTLAGGGAANQQGVYGLMESNAALSPEYTAVIKDSTGAPVHKTAFNFNPSSAKFVREVFNTNPQLVNSAVVDTTSLMSGEASYWLGETFEYDIQRLIDASVLTNPHAMIVALSDGTTDRSNMRKSFQKAQTGWFISQDLTSNTASYSPATQTPLFRIEARDGGEWSQSNLKISIENVKASTSLSSPYGSFDVVVRRASDSDNVVSYLERFSNLTLNPASEKYIGLVIGDKYMEYDTVQNRIREYGQFDNKSKYIRVEVKDDVASGLTDPAFLPFGVFGPPIPAPVVLVSGSDAQTVAAAGATSIIMSGSAAGISSISLAPASSQYSAGGYATHTASLFWASTDLRTDASAGGISNPKDAFFGASSAQALAKGNSKHDKSWPDYLRAFPDNLQSTLTPSWVFSLDDIVTQNNKTQANWVLNARLNGLSLTAVSGGYTEILDAGYNSFTAPLYGGFDGLKIQEIEPFRNSAMGSTETELTNYAINSVKQALQSIQDPEFVEYNLMAMPGITNTALTQQMIDICSERADALAVVDLEKVYDAFTESTESFKDRIYDPSEAVTSLRARQIDSSYACAYYPWVQIRDTNLSRVLWVPPSVIALGTMAGSEAKSAVWFAPAGFNRGGLTEGAAGVPVTGLTYKLTSKDRDSLYDASINPIASFPSEGIVMFGQKTLQMQKSALDRINVRRLMIYVKKQISRIASQLLFDQNVRTTWNRFTSQVNPFLASIQSGLGLSEFKVVLDETTTTPDLIDQNIMYAKIFLKPARAIEYIAVDFVITRTGASFED